MIYLITKVHNQITSVKSILIHELVNSTKSV